MVISKIVILVKEAKRVPKLIEENEKKRKGKK